MKTNYKKSKSKVLPSPEPGDVITYYDQNEKERIATCIKTMRTRCRVNLPNGKKVYIYRNDIKKEI